MKAIIQAFLFTTGFFIVSGFLLTVLAADKPLRVVVLDTGLNLSDSRFAGHLCNGGHRDFSGVGLIDTVGHGTHVAGLIQQYAKDANYCLIIVKYWNSSKDELSNENSFIAGLRYALSLHPDFLNLSVAGSDFKQVEKDLIEAHPETQVLGAAGNQGISRVSYPCGYSLPNTTCVGSVDDKGNIAAHSNRGYWVQAWERGDVMSTLPYGHFGMMLGTSQATAIHTGKMVHSVGIVKDYVKL